MMLLPLVALALSLSTSQPMAADLTAQPAAEPVFIVQPEWEVRPEGQDVMRLFPADAVKAGISGQAVIQCGVLADGHLDRCQVVAELPEGHGFGEASVEMGALFKMRPTLADGQSVEGAQVLIPLNWNLGGSKSSD